MKTYTFASVFKPEMDDFVQLRSSQGLRDYSKLYIIKNTIDIFFMLFYTIY
jgi:hypothetical protein